MADHDKIEGLLRHLCTYLGHLREIAAMGQERFLADPLLIGSARYYLQISVEQCLNIAQHLIATQRLRAPRDYRDTFRVLQEAGILPVENAQKMQALAGLRNLLVHVYWDVDDAMIYVGLRDELQDFEEYVQHILAYLERS